MGTPAAGMIAFSVSIAAVSVLSAASPNDIGYIDVTTGVYGADKSGITDATDAIQRAVNDARDARKVVFFPAGDYLISRTILCENLKDSSDRQPVALVGSVKDPAKRARLVLMDNAPGFADTAVPKIVVHFRTVVAYSTDPAATESNTVTYRMLFESIDIKIGAGNSGAVGLRMQSAEGTGIYDVTVDMTTSGFMGLWGLPGSGGSTHGLRILGGVIGVNCRSWPDNTVGPGAQPSPTISNSSFIGQKSYAFMIRARGGFVVVASRIERSQPGPVVYLQQHWLGQPYDGMLGMVDCRIEYTFSSADNKVVEQASSTTGNSFYFTNVYVKNAAAVHRGDEGDVTSNPNGWTWFKELALDVGLGTRAGLDIEHGIYLNGSFWGRNKAMVDSRDVLAPPADLLSRHSWGASLPSFESPGVGLITDYSAYKIGEDWAPAIQKAVDAHEIVFVPAGEYWINNTVKLKANTKLIGVFHLTSKIVGVDPKPARFGGNTDPMNTGVPMIETVDEATATTMLAHVGIHAGFPTTQHSPEPVGHYSLKWQTGRNSIVRMVNFAPKAIDFMRYEYMWERYFALRELDVPYTNSGLTFTSNCPEAWLQSTLASKILYESKAFGGDVRLMSRNHSPASNLTVSDAAGGDFTLDSLDLGSGLYYTDDPRYAVTFTGYKSAGGTVVKTYDFGADGKLNPRQRLETIRFNWTGLSKVEITAPTGFGIDNVATGGGALVTFNELPTIGLGSVTVVCGRQWLGFDNYSTGPLFHPSVLITGNGGGRWYNYWQHGDFVYERNSAFVRIANNSEPMQVYHCHMQHAQLDVRWDLRGANLIDIYNIKTENITNTVRVTGGDNIRIIGHGGMTNPTPGCHHYQFTDVPNFLLVCFSEQVNFGTSFFRGGSCDNPLSQGGILLYDSFLEEIGGQKIVLDKAHRPIVYRRGAPVHFPPTTGSLPVRHTPTVLTARAFIGSHAGTTVAMIRTENDRPVNVQILNGSGRQVLSRTLRTAGTHRIPVNMAEGIYLLRMKSGTAPALTQRFAVVR